MAILYVLTIDDPTNVGPFPPDVLASDWYANFISSASFQAIGGNTGYVYSWIFDNQTEIDSWTAEYKAPSDVQSSLDNWKTFSVSYENKFYTLPATTGTGIIN
jgi:hypothetical protein